MDVCKVNFAAYYELAVQRKSHCRSDDLCNGKDYGKNGRSFVAYFKFAVLARTGSKSERTLRNPFPMVEVKISGETDLSFLNSVNPLVTKGGGKEISFSAFLLRGQRFQ